MRKYLKLASVSIGLLLALPAFQSRANILVDQSPPSRENAFFSDLSFSQVMADDFTLTSAASPDSITFWGTYSPSDIPLTPDRFSLAIYSDVGDMPGSVISFSHISPVRTYYGLTTQGTGLYEYNASLTPVDLAAGTYWLVIVNDTSAVGNDTWAWAISAEIYNAFGAFATESSRTPSHWNRSPLDLAFTLSAVPEPSSLALAGLASVGLAVVMRLRRGRVA